MASVTISHAELKTSYAIMRLPLKRNWGYNHLKTVINIGRLKMAYKCTGFARKFRKFDWWASRSREENCGPRNRIFGPQLRNALQAIRYSHFIISTCIVSTNLSQRWNKPIPEENWGCLFLIKNRHINIFCYCFGDLTVHLLLYGYDFLVFVLYCNCCPALLSAMLLLTTKIDWMVSYGIRKRPITN